MLGFLKNGRNIIGSIRQYNSFSKRHIGPNTTEITDMLRVCNVNTLDNLIEEVIPNIKKHSLKHFPEISEKDSHTKLKNIMDKNIDTKNYIGLGYTQSILPNVIKRNLIENPKWYTAYTPYQSEISQGRLESLHNFQKIVTDLTGLELSNASLLDEASSASEVLNMFLNKTKFKKNDFYCSKDLHPYILEVLKTKSKIANINLHICNLDNVEVNENTLGILFQYPNTYGEIDIPFNLLEECRKKNILTSANTNLLALTKIISPKELELDVSFGNAGNLGVPLWYGGPHPAFISCNKDLLRFMPGRIIGKSIDTQNNEAFRIALQTREQHIRKDKATSNICTSQALLANVSSMYCLYHGKEGLINIHDKIYNNTKRLYYELKKNYINVINENFFDTIVIEKSYSNHIYEHLKKNNILVRKIDDNKLGITIDETIESNDIDTLVNLITKCTSIFIDNEVIGDVIIKDTDYKLIRKTSFLDDDIFKKYNTETKMQRYINKLSDKDYTLVDGMIPLGSCTMKLNSASQLEPLLWKKITDIHPYAPTEFVKGYHSMINLLSEYLKDITGFNNVSYQSNSGAMGEYSGLLCIKKFHEENKEKRNICLIPNTAHGTNYASAKLAGMEIITFDDNITLDEFRDLVNKYKYELSCLMITYPGTNGVFQKNIFEINEIIHNNGGLVYMDGANMNALVGLTSPASCGADVCHLNLHKTFCIPHGGGGPGMGPILCNDKLAKYLPNNKYQSIDNSHTIGNITSSQWSSASILTIPLLYILTMGSDNLKLASKIAILNSNYLKESLRDYYLIKDVNEHNRVGHEFIIDTSEFRKYNITELDISKRLIDYNFHPGTMSWPKNNVMMIEPTESESKEELDRFIEAMKSIKNEINEIIDNNYDLDNNIIKNSPHSLNLLNEEWVFDYSFKKAYFPVNNLENKKFPSVNRVNDSLGDKNLLKN